MDEPLTELAAYLRRDTRLPDPELVRLTAAARAGGSRPMRRPPTTPARRGR
jgi:hypothetical protein